MLGPESSNFEIEQRMNELHELGSKYLKILNNGESEDGHEVDLLEAIDEELFYLYDLKKNR